VRAIRPLLDAVVAGRFEETISRRRGKITWSEGVVRDADGNVLTKVRMGRFPRSHERVVIKYEPFS